MVIAFFTNYHFDDTSFPPLKNIKTPLGVRHNISKKVPNMSHLYPHTSMNAKCRG